MRITEKKLKQGDVLLYSGTSWIAPLIKKIDGTEVSHAGLYLGAGRVGEALFRGIVENPLSQSIQECKWVKVLRHHASVEGDDMKFVIQSAKGFLTQGDRYAFEQILLLAFVCSARKINYTSNPIFRKFAQSVIGRATAILEQFRNENREPMICSEFVYRSFDEALSPEQDRYSIQIGTHIAKDESPKRRFRLFRKQPKVDNLPPFSAIEPGSLLDSLATYSNDNEMLASSPPPEYAYDDVKIDYTHEEQELSDLIQQYFEDQDNKNGGFVCGSIPSENDDVAIDELTQSAQLFATLLAESELLANDLFTSSPTQSISPDFVTPGDLLNSPSFEDIGELIP